MAQLRLLTADVKTTLQTAKPFDIALDCIGESIKLSKVTKPKDFVIPVVDGKTGDTFTSVGGREPGKIVRFFLWIVARFKKV